jgi:hypothetical protein
MEEIRNPQRYTQEGNKMECWDFWLHYGLNPLIASAVKYVWRYKDKNGKHDLEKALVFLEKAYKEAYKVQYSGLKRPPLDRDDFKSMDFTQFLIIENSTLTVDQKTYILGINNMFTLIEKLIGEEYDIY